MASTRISTSDNYWKRSWRQLRKGGAGATNQPAGNGSKSRGPLSRISRSLDCDPYEHSSISGLGAGRGQYGRSQSHAQLFPGGSRSNRRHCICPGEKPSGEASDRKARNSISSERLYRRHGALRVGRALRTYGSFRDWLEYLLVRVSPGGDRNAVAFSEE